MGNKIEELVYINKENYSSKDNWEYINYLDTSNITENVIDNIVKLDIGVDKVPSRAKRKVKKNDIIISTVRPNQKHYGFISNPVENMLVSTGFTVLTPKDKVNQYYLYLFLTQEHLTNELQSIAEGSTSTYPSLKPNDIGNLEINLPEISIQYNVVNILKTIDTKIELNNKINNNLEETSKALYNEWFVNFNFLNEDGLPYKDNGGEFVDSELGKIPVGWEVKSLTDIANFLNGLAIKKYQPKDNEESLPVLKIKELRQGYTDNNSDRCGLNIPNHDYIINDGDLIFSWSGTLFIDYWTGGDSILNQHLFKVTSNNYDLWFYDFWCRYHLETFINIAKDKTTTMGHIRRSDLVEAKVLIPVSNIYNELTKKAEPIIKKIILTKGENKRLNNLKQFLLNKLMSGQIDINYLDLDWDKLSKTLEEIE